MPGPGATFPALIASTIPWRVGLLPAALSVAANVYAAAMPYSTLPSNGAFASYWSWIFLNSAIHGFEVSATDGRYPSVYAPSMRAVFALPFEKDFRSPPTVVGSAPTFEM